MEALKSVRPTSALARSHITGNVCAGALTHHWQRLRGAHTHYVAASLRSLLGDE
jgi:hypothetical protein